MSIQNRNIIIANFNMRKLNNEIRGVAKVQSLEKVEFATGLLDIRVTDPWLVADDVALDAVIGAHVNTPIQTNGVTERSLLQNVGGQNINLAASNVITFDASDYITPEFSFNGTDTITVTKAGFIREVNYFVRIASSNNGVKQEVVMNINGLPAKETSTELIGDNAAEQVVAYGKTTRIAVAVNDTITLVSNRLKGAAAATVALGLNVCGLRIRYGIE